MSRSIIRPSFATFFLLLTIITGGASKLYSAPPSFDPQMATIKESKAYKSFLVRPYSELSKIIYLIDRFKEAKIKIVYEDIFFEPQFVVRVAKWFLSQHYQKESAKEWIMVYCNQSLVARKLIWVADEKNGFKLSREVLLDELKDLESTLASDPNFKGIKKAA